LKCLLGEYVTNSKLRTPYSELARKGPAFVLTVAGSDSSGGAGIQADLKAFRANGVPGLTAITGLTAQNSRGITHIHPAPLENLLGQLEAVDGDFHIVAAKTGMLPTADAIRTVAAFFRARPALRLVVDPVLIATSGASLRLEDTTQALLTELIPLASVVTPNLDEAAVLGGRELVDSDEGADLLWAQFHVPFLLKGGHGNAAIVRDVLITGEGKRTFEYPRLEGEYHGTGCILSASIAAGLAKGSALPEAVERAEAFLHGEMTRAIVPGKSELRYLLMN
jgi:hydroxymethylpyrimidine/phosphomethylpyrimidine kinase